MFIYSALPFSKYWCRLVTLSIPATQSIFVRGESFLGLKVLGWSESFLSTLFALLLASALYSCAGEDVVTYQNLLADSSANPGQAYPSPVLIGDKYGYGGGFDSGQQHPIYPDVLLRSGQVRDAVQLMPPQYRDDVRGALIKAGPNMGSLISAIYSLSPDQRTGLAFLLVNMNLDDLLSISGQDLAEDVALAYQAKDQSPWGKDIPEDIFLNYVVPYASLDEPRDSWRSDFFESFKDRAWGCRTPGEAAVLLNKEIFKDLNVTYSATKRHRPNQSPRESIQISYASCTGLSIILVDACRACGIPARIAGTLTLNGGDNHNWVEVWSGKWHYLGASEPSELDKTWFSAPLRRSAQNATDWRYRVYSTSFKRTGQFFPLAWAEGSLAVPGEDVTSYYTKDRPAD
jgi:hypothetical protein